MELTDKEKAQYDAAQSAIRQSLAGLSPDFLYMHRRDAHTGRWYVWKFKPSPDVLEAKPVRLGTHYVVEQGAKERAFILNIIEMRRVQREALKGANNG